MFSFSRAPRRAHADRGEPAPCVGCACRRERCPWGPVPKERQALRRPLRGDVDRGREARVRYGVGKLGWAREDDAPINLGIPSMLAVARLPHRWRPLRGAFMATRPWTRIRAGAGLVPAPPGARSCRRTRTTPETSRRYSSPWEALSRQRASPCGRSPACAGERRAERRHRGGRQQHGLGEGEPPIVRQAMSAPLLVLDDVGQEGAARETPRGSRSREPVVSARRRIAATLCARTRGRSAPGHLHARGCGGRMAALPAKLSTSTRRHVAQTMSRLFLSPCTPANGSRSAPSRADGSPGPHLTRRKSACTRTRTGPCSGAGGAVIAALCVRLPDARGPAHRRARAPDWADTDLVHNRLDLDVNKTDRPRSWGST
jgi:hypothetical protein